MIEKKSLSGVVIDENSKFTLQELSTVCGVSIDWLIALVDEGILEPEGNDPVCWSFCHTSLRRVRVTQRLESDLGVNLPGAALVLELLDEVESLRKFTVL